TRHSPYGNKFQKLLSKFSAFQPWVGRRDRDGQGRMEAPGTHLLCKKVLRSRRTCISEHRARSKALSIMMPVGPTAEWARPLPQSRVLRRTKWLAVVQRAMQVREIGCHESRSAL